MTTRQDGPVPYHNSNIITGLQATSSRVSNSGCDSVQGVGVLCSGHALDCAMHSYWHTSGMADDEAKFGILAAAGPTAASVLKRALEDEGVQVLYFSDGSGKPETLRRRRV